MPLDHSLHSRGSLRRVKKHRRLADQVADELRKAIFDGVFKPGEHLPEDKLSEELGVSRTPLREAFRKLEEEGLLKVSDGRGVEVTQPDVQECIELYDIREMVDGLSARRSANAGDTEFLAELEGLMGQMQQHLSARQYHEWQRCDTRFHETITHASGNKRLLRLLPAIRFAVQIYYPTLVNYEERLWNALREHQRILDAIRSGNGEEAEQRAREHIRNARDQLMALLVPSGIPR